MRRRTLLAGAAAALGGAGAALAGLTACQPGARPRVTPSLALPTDGPAPVAYWRRSGGFAPAGHVALRPPVLAAYVDGQVVAQATRMLKLPGDELATLVSRLAHDLAGLPPALRSHSNVQITDLTDTVIGVRTADREQAVTAYGLDELREHGAYPAPIYTAQDRLVALKDRAAKSGEPYTAARVRLVVEPATGAGAAIVPWPAGVPVPQQDRLGAKVTDLDGEVAKLAVAGIPVDSTGAKPWSTLRTPDGKLVLGAWRYLLPEE